MYAGFGEFYGFFEVLLDQLGGWCEFFDRFFDLVPVVVEVGDDGSSRGVNGGDDLADFKFDVIGV